MVGGGVVVKGERGPGDQRYSDALVGIYFSSHQYSDAWVQPRKLVCSMLIATEMNIDFFEDIVCWT